MQHNLNREKCSFQVEIPFLSIPKNPSLGFQQRPLLPQSPRSLRYETIYPKPKGTPPGGGGAGNGDPRCTER